jgi:DNA-binding NarL/FixJ family response regulator
MNNQPQPIKIVLADNHYLILQSIQSFFKPIRNITLTGHAKSFQELLMLTDTVKPDVIVMESTLLPGIENPESIRVLSAKSSIPIILYEHFMKPLHYLHYINKSVHGIISKQAPGEVFMEGIQKVHKGEYFYCSTSQQYIDNVIIEMEEKANKIKERFLTKKI